jgi:hypothetical protein
MLDTIVLVGHANRVADALDPTLLMAIWRVSAELCTSGMQTAVSQI